MSVVRTSINPLNRVAVVFMVLLVHINYAVCKKHAQRSYSILPTMEVVEVIFHDVNLLRLFTD